eukprot:TRINITY_DN97_c0_g2_i1.p1 TRINITY_DN97_c0_g2~~TRINITY_DN97_c0_g2_i1.p1  ORF type:complete len:496 (+),score=167.00 TRINITY_DN97_c0_g2_i1:126-1613(+)
MLQCNFCSVTFPADDIELHINSFSHQRNVKMKKQKPASAFSEKKTDMAKENAKQLFDAFNTTQADEPKKGKCRNGRRRRRGRKRRVNDDDEEESDTHPKVNQPSRNPRRGNRKLIDIGESGEIRGNEVSLEDLDERMPNQRVRRGGRFNRGKQNVKSPLRKAPFDNAKIQIDFKQKGVHGVQPSSLSSMMDGIKQKSMSETVKQVLRRSKAFETKAKNCFIEFVKSGVSFSPKVFEIVDEERDEMFESLLNAMMESLLEAEERQVLSNCMWRSLYYNEVNWTLQYMKKSQLSVESPVGGRLKYLLVYASNQFKKVTEDLRAKTGLPENMVGFGSNEEEGVNKGEAHENESNVTNAADDDDDEDDSESDNTEDDFGEEEEEVIIRRINMQLEEDKDSRISEKIEEQLKKENFDGVVRVDDQCPIEIVGIVSGRVEAPQDNAMILKNVYEGVDVVESDDDVKEMLEIQNDDEKQEKEEEEEEMQIRGNVSATVGTMC